MVKAVATRRFLALGDFDQNDGHRLGSKEWYIRENHLTQAFKKCALEELGILNHPKSDDVFEYVWKEFHGRDHDFKAVLENLEIIAGFLRP